MFFSTGIQFYYILALHDHDFTVTSHSRLRRFCALIHGTEFSRSSWLNMEHLPAELTCAEKIALLTLLHPIPTPPSPNPIDHRLTHQTGYILSFERERSVTAVLAFLSSLDDNPNHVKAVCVKEELDTASLHVFLAVNRAGEDDGNQVLLDTRQGFEKLFTILGQITDGRHPELYLFSN